MKKIIISITAITLIIVGYLIIKENNEDVVKIGIARWVTNDEYDRNIEGFIEGLAAGGYKKDENIVFIIKNPEADKKEQEKIIKYFIEEDVDLIYSLTTPGTLIAKALTEDIPIVFSIVTYPEEAGIIESLRSSGNNLVGTRNYVPVSKQYYDFERIVEGVKTLAIIHREGEPNSEIQFNEFTDLLQNRGIEIIDIAAVDLEDLKIQLNDNISKIDALYSTCDTLVQSGGEEIVIEFSMRYEKPSFTCNKDGILKGALMGNVADFFQIGEMAGEKAAQILEGVEPTWLTTETQRFDNLIINQKTAESLGLSIDQEILDHAEKIISE